MAGSKHTGDPAIDTVINQLHKHFSKSLITLGPAIKTVPAISTGSLGLDLALGIGGWPQGRIVELFGKAGSGKTSLALAGARNAQILFPDKYVLIVDMEYTMTGAQFESFGLDKDRLLFLQCDTVGEAFQSVKDLVNTGKISFVVFDSIDACQTEAMLNKDIAANDVGGISKIASRFFREFSKITVKQNCCSIFINQTKQNPGVMFGSSNTTPGGTALGFYATHRVEASPIKPSPTMSNAFLGEYKITKNKCAPIPSEKISFDFIYNKGPDPIIDTLNAGKDLGVLVFSGPNLKLVSPDGTSKVVCNGGAAGWIKHCRSEPDILQEVRDACMATREGVLPPDPILELDALEPLPDQLMEALNGELKEEQPV